MATHLPQPVAARSAAIPPARERFQSWLMVTLWALIVFPFVSIIAAVHTDNAIEDHALLTSQPMHAVYISIVLTLLVLALRAATPAAAACGGIICFSLALAASTWTQHLYQTLLPSLVLLFLLTYTATHIGRRRKLALGVAEHPRGRTASQIVANIGVASLAAMMQTVSFAFTVAALAVLAEATADTLSSELGPLLPGPTLLINTLRPVRPGTDGGVSLGGTLFGVAGAALVTWSGIHALQIGWPEAWIAFLCAVFGLLTDSVLGATLERRGLIGNDMVNLLSSSLTALIAASFAYMVLGYL